MGDTISLLEAIRLLERWRGGQGATGDPDKEGTSADTLNAALKSGAIRASGCIDGHQRKEISPDEWQDYQLVFRPRFFSNAQFLNAPGTTIIKVISKRPFPASVLNLRYHPAGIQLPSDQSSGEPGFYLEICDVLLSREDIMKAWPESGGQVSVPRAKGERRKPDREIAVAAIGKLYPEGVPDQKFLPNKALCAAVHQALGHLPHGKISSTTILRAAHRRKN